MSKYVKKFILDSLICGQVITFLNAFAIIISVAIFTENKLEPGFLAIIFLLTSSMYFFDFFEDKSDDNFSYKQELTILKHKKWLFVLLVMIFLISSAWIISLYEIRYGMMFLIFLMLLGLLYPIFFKKLTVNIPVFKDFFVAFGWNLLVFFYFIFHNIPITYNIVALLILIFLRDFVNVCFSDIKDIVSDRKNNLKTLAVIMGQSRLMRSLQIINFICILLVLFLRMIDIFNNSELLLIIPIIITSLLMHVGHKKNSYSTVIVDSEFYIWLLVALLSARS